MDSDVNLVPKKINKNKKQNLKGIKVLLGKFPKSIFCLSFYS